MKLNRLTNTEYIIYCITNDCRNVDCTKLFRVCSSIQC